MKNRFDFTKYTFINLSKFYSKSYLFEGIFPFFELYIKKKQFENKFKYNIYEPFL